MPEPAPTLRPWGRLPGELAPVLRAELESTARAVAGTVAGSVPAFAEIDDPKFERDLNHAVRVALERFVELIGSREPALPPQVRDTFVGLGAAEAREDRSPEALLAALRLASRLLLRTAFEALAAVRPVAPDELLDLSDAVTAFIDELAAASTDGFALQVQELAGETDRRRRLLAGLLLRGGAPEPAVRSAAAGIGWHRLDALVPVLLPLDRARDARFRHGGEAVVVEREQDAVMLLREAPRAGRPQLAEYLRGPGVVVGPTLPWQRVPEAVRLAELTAQLVPPGSGPVFAADHLVTLALHGESSALSVLSQRRLGAFAGLPEGTRDRLLETLHSWLLHWGSRADVAAELYVHPQTVSYRLKRLRELLGDDVDDATARFELLVALSGRLRRPA
jgi:hypothetical protein